MEKQKKIQNKKEKKQKEDAKKTGKAQDKAEEKSKEYKSLVPENKSEKIKIAPEKIKNLSITEAKIKKMLSVEHLEELFHILNLLDDKQISLFLQHYKNSEIEKSKDQKIDTLIKSAKDDHELLESLKKELSLQLSEELEKLKANISELTKKGIDTYIESIKTLSIKSKVRMFLATGKKEDFYKVKKMLFSLDESLKPKREELKKIEERKKAKEETIEREEKKKKGKAQV